MEAIYKNEFARLEAEREAEAFMSKLEYEKFIEVAQPIKKMWTPEEMKDILNRYDDQVCKAVVKIYENQTSDEKSSYETKHVNGIGFNGADAAIMSRFAEFYIRYGFLSPKMMMIARKKIMKYAGQLCRIANA